MILYLLLFIISEKEVVVVKSENPPVVDGILSEEMWKSAIVIKDFVQLMPQKGALPTESTFVYLMYDDNALYIGVMCFQDPRTIKANTTIRDHQRIGWDDAIGIFICPKEEERMIGYVFMVNAIGTQLDSKIYEGGNTFFNEWDEHWQAITAMSDNGWSAEIVLPFDILTISKEISQMGFNFIRGILHKMEVISWCNVSNQQKIGEWGIVKGFNIANVHKGQKYNLFPYGSIFIRNEKTIPKTGIDAFKINWMNKFKSEFTLYPDYAHIEADVDEFNLDKLPQWLPEKRPFFIEDLGMFDTPITLLYTRSIADIKAGVKVVSEFPGVDIGILGTILDTVSNEMTFSGRLKNSTSWYNIGFLGIKNFEPENLILDMDALLNLPKQIYLSGQIAKTWQENNESSFLHYYLLKRTVDVGLNFSLHYKYIPPDFVDVRGYIPMNDLISRHVSLSPKFQVNKLILRDFSVNAGYVNWQTTSHHRIKEAMWGGLGLTFLKNIIGFLSYSDEERIYDTETYNNRLWTSQISYLPGGMSGANLGFVYGDYWGGVLYYPSINLNFTFSQNFTNSLVLNYQLLKFSDGTSDTSLIFVYIPSFNIYKNLNIRAFIQWSDKSEVLMTNYLLDWTIYRRTKLYLALNRTEALSNEEEPSWVFFIKASSGIWF